MADALPAASVPLGGTSVATRGGPPPLAPPRASTGQRLLLLAITLAAAVWRVATLGKESLWIDEGTSLHLARLPLAEIVEDRAKDGHTPAYFLLLHYWVKWFGDTPEALRSLSVIPGTLTVPLLYLAAARWRGPTAGLFAAALGAGSVFLSRYAQEARDYAFLFFFATASFWALDRALERASPGRLLLWALALAGTLWSSVFGLVVYAAQALYLVYRGAEARLAARRAGTVAPPLRAALPWVFAAALAAALFVPWLVVLAKRAETHETLWMKPPPFLVTYEALVALAGSRRGLALLLPAVLAVLWFTVGPGTAERRRGWLLATWLLGPILLLWLLSYALFPIFVQRGTICATGGFVVLGALGLDALRPNRRVFAVVALLAVAGLVFGMYRLVDRRDKADWKGLSELVASKAAPGDVVLLRGRDEIAVVGVYIGRSDVLLAAHGDAAAGRILWGSLSRVHLVDSVHAREGSEHAREALRKAGFSLREHGGVPLIGLEQWER